MDESGERPTGQLPVAGMASLEAIESIFDMDGLIVDSEPRHERAFEQNLTLKAKAWKTAGAPSVGDSVLDCSGGRSEH